MKCFNCRSKPCICHRIVIWPAEIGEIIAREDKLGVDCNEETGLVKYSSGKGGRYWFDETKGLISLDLLKALILFAHRAEGKELKINKITEAKAREIYANRANGYCYMDKSGFPVLKDNKVALMSELCVDELEAIFNLVYREWD